MLQKHRQILILLVGLLYGYSVCPFLCTVLEQKFCYDRSQEILGGDTGTHSTCCQSTKTKTAGEVDNSSESGKLCCSKHLELILPNDTHESRESIAQSFVSILPISVTVSVATWESFKVPPTLFSTLFPDYSLTRRGPPSA